ncbi:MAG: hypothetical protein OXH39_17220 [Candidatus Poribacteria bacterium]|nr:hypothetical protein [Candidatus Poribacteria bacterium]
MRDWPEPDQDAWLAYLDHFGEPDDNYYQRLEEAFYEEEAKISANPDVRVDEVDEDEAYYAPCADEPYCPSCGVNNCSCHYELTEAQEAAAQADYENELAMGAALAAAEEFHKEAQTSANAATAIASSKAILAAAKAKAALSEVRAALVLDKSTVDAPAKVKVKEETKSSLADVEEAISKAHATLVAAEEAKSTLVDAVDALVQFHLLRYDEEDHDLIEVKTALIQVKVVLADAKIDLTKAKATLADVEAKDAIVNAEVKTEIKNALTLTEADVTKARIDIGARTKTETKVEVSAEQMKNQGIEAHDISNEIGAIAAMYEAIMNIEGRAPEIVEERDHIMNTEVSTLANTKLEQDSILGIFEKFQFRSESETKTYKTLAEAKTVLAEVGDKDNASSVGLTFAVLTETEAETLAKVSLTKANAETMVLAEALALILAEVTSTKAEKHLAKLTNELSCPISVLKECREKSFRIFAKEARALSAAEEAESALAAAEEARDALTAAINALDDAKIKVSTLTVDLTFTVLTETEALIAAEAAKVKALTEAETALVEAAQAKAKMDLTEAIETETNAKTVAVKALVEAAETQTKADLAEVQAYLVKALASASKIEPKIGEHFTNACCDQIAEVKSLSNVLTEVLAKAYTTESILDGASLANAILTGSKVKIDEVLANAKDAYAES